MSDIPKHFRNSDFRLASPLLMKRVQAYLSLALGQEGSGEAVKSMVSRAVYFAVRSVSAEYPNLKDVAEYLSYSTGIHGRVDGHVLVIESAKTVLVCHLCENGRELVDEGPGEAPRGWSEDKAGLLSCPDCTAPAPSEPPAARWQPLPGELDRPVVKPRSMWRNKKNQAMYEVLDPNVRNATNAQDGQGMVAYTLLHAHQIFVREQAEFVEKFEWVQDEEPS